MTSPALQHEYSRWPHFFAIVLSCATFPLIWVGGLVTTYDAGMAVPDWPTTYGYNMFLYPISTWVSGPWDLFIEHGHRLLGSLAGLLTILLNVVIWKYDSRRWMRYVGAAALVMVVSQGMLGGMRVRLSSTDFARAHGVTGPLFFALTISICVLTSRFWWNVRGKSQGQKEDVGHRLTIGRRHVVNGWVLFAIAYFQLILGAHLRHPNIDWTPSFFRVLVLFHVVAAFFVLFLAGQVWWQSRGSVRSLSRPATVAFLLVIGQVTLGIATWRAKYGVPNLTVWSEATVDRPMEVAVHSAVVGQTIQNAGMMQVLTVTSHVAMGSLILAASIFYATRLTHWFASCCNTEREKLAFSTEPRLGAAVGAMGGSTS